MPSHVIAPYLTNALDSPSVHVNKLRRPALSACVRAGCGLERFVGVDVAVGVENVEERTDE